MVLIGNYEVDSDLLYYDEYTWINRISDTEANIGLTDYGQKILKDVTTINPPRQGQRFVAGSDMLTIESIAKDIVMNSPASLVILEVNIDVVSTPDMLNDAPYDNWIVKVEILDLGDLDNLMDGDEMSDIILEKVGADVDEKESFEDEFDYESEFSIDSSDSYYEEEQDNYW